MVVGALPFGVTALFSWKHMQVHMRIFAHWKPLLVSVAVPSPSCSSTWCRYSSLGTFDFEDRCLFRLLIPARRAPR